MEEYISRVEQKYKNKGYKKLLALVKEGALIKSKEKQIERWKPNFMEMLSSSVLQESNTCEISDNILYLQ